jgi:hypothetical protein
VLKAVYLNSKESISLGVPSVLFKAIELKEALREDAPA